MKRILLILWFEANSFFLSIHFNLLLKLLKIARPKQTSMYKEVNIVYLFFIFVGTLSIITKVWEGFSIVLSIFSFNKSFKNKMKIFVFTFNEYLIEKLKSLKDTAHSRYRLRLKLRFYIFHDFPLLIHK